jgi:hypothetical protein
MPGLDRDHAGARGPAWLPCIGAPGRASAARGAIGRALFPIRSVEVLAMFRQLLFPSMAPKSPAGRPQAVMRQRRVRGTLAMGPFACGRLKQRPTFAPAFLSQRVFDISERM